MNLLYKVNRSCRILTHRAAAKCEGVEMSELAQLLPMPEPYTKAEPSIRLSSKVEIPEEVWNVREVAQYLGISEEKVRIDARKGLIPGKQLGSLWLFRKDKVRAMFE